MGVLGVSIIVASVVYVIAFPVAWLPEWLQRFRRGLGGAITRGPAPSSDDDAKAQSSAGQAASQTNASSGTTTSRDAPDLSSVASRKARDEPSISSPPPPPPTIELSTLPEPAAPDSDEQTTPKAVVSQPSQPVPSFSLSEELSSPPEPAPRPAPSTTPSMMMPPPPRPSPTPNRLPQFPAANSAQRARGPVPNRGPIPNRGGALAPPAAGLAPPPTHSSKPSKPSRQVILAPGRSPLDWARISGPSADLRGLPASTPYLRVTPSMLKRQTGRKGKDAWMGLNGKVYNITPYAEFHPGGVPELMRGAGRDGTKLFGEIHPWVNYETMLSSCLVGLLVDEPEGNQESEMDKMD